MLRYVSKHLKSAMIACSFAVPLLGCGGEPPCGPCDFGDWYICHSVPGQISATSCQPNQAYADLWCANLGGQNPEISLCDVADGESGGSEEGPSNSEWNPADHIAQDPRSGTYQIDATFVADLHAKSFTQLYGDQARAITALSGYTQLVNVSSTDLVALLGLESGDILVNINGRELNNTDAIVEAYAALSKSTSFVLTINRGGRMLRLSYQLVE